MSSGKRVFIALSILLSSTSLFLTACNDPPLTSHWGLQNTDQFVSGTVGTRCDRFPLLINREQSASPHQPSRHRFITHEVTHEN